MSEIDHERYECWTAARTRTVKLIHFAGGDGFYHVPREARGYGPWTDALRGRVADLKPEIQLRLCHDMFVLFRVDMADRAAFQIEVPTPK